MIVLGADVGGTSSRIALYHDGVEKATAEGAGMPMRAGKGEQLAEMLADLAKPLLMRHSAARVDAFVVGASGAGREQERRELEAALKLHKLAWRVLVTTDADLAREAAFEGGPGVLLIAGTGSIAFVQEVDGTRRRVGGLGWRMGDEGSGYWLGLRALQAVGAMHESTGPVTHLAEALPVAARVAGIAGLIRWSTTASPAQVASLAPAVVAAAAHGDAVAIQLCDAVVSALVDLALRAGAAALPVAFSGGLLIHDKGLRERVASSLEHEHGTTVIRRVFTPCRGAIVLARS